MGDAITWATPFAKNVLTSTTNNAQLAAERAANSYLNGSGPNDTALANQSPLGLTDFITGARSGLGATKGVTASAGFSGSPVLILVILVAAILLLRK